MGETAKQVVAFARADLEDPIHVRFESRASAYAKATAIVDGSEALTYRDLERTANRIGHAILRRLGSHCEPVAVLMAKAPRAVAAQLGVYKAGKIYVPLDAGFPRERIVSILRDSETRLVVTDGQNLAVAREVAGDGVHVLLADSPLESVAESRPNLRVSADSPAWILYTSGTTGEPKGVVRDHRAVMHWAMTNTRQLGIRPGEKFAHLFSLAVAAGAHEVLGPLLAGGELHLFDLKSRGFPALAEWLRKDDINHLRCVATMFRHLCAALDPADRFPDLRTIRVGGETVYRSDAELFRQHFGGALLIHRLGGTETGTVRTLKVTEDTELDTEILPVGYEAEDMEVTIAGEDGHPVPPGEAGEIWIRGRYLSRGYWRRPELTAAAFRPGGPGDLRRTYRTGDLGRLSEDGCLHHLGRRDSVVKIRGHRVELGAVEAALRRLAGIHDAVVLARPDETGEQRLAAYYVPVEEPGPTVTELRRALSQTLSEPMLPGAFVKMPEFPLTPNGKVNRSALPAPEAGRPRLEKEFAEPRTATEADIAGIWSEVLKLPAAGIHDDFLDLGGDSLKAGQIAARIHSRLGKEIGPAEVMAAGTVAKLSTMADGLAVSSGERLGEGGTLPRRGSSESRPRRLSFAQQRIWFLDRFEREKTIYNISKALRLKGKLDAEVLRRALSAVVARHEILRTVYATAGGQPVQQVQPPMEVELPIVDLRRLERSAVAPEVDRIRREQARRPFDLSADCMVRALLIRTEAEEHILALTFHHIASDGWSAGIFYEDLSSCYNSLLNGSGELAPPLPLQYPDYAEWQREHLTDDILRPQIAWWREQLLPARGLLPLPTDHPRGAAQMHRGDCVPYRLPDKLCGRLRALAEREAVTNYMVVLAAFQTLLYRYTGSERVAVGSPVASRRREETEGLIGFFSNTLVMNTDLSGEPTFVELLDRVRRVTLDARAHQDVPFERLVEELDPPRSLSHTPLFQVMLVQQASLEDRLSLAGITSEQFDPVIETSMFDLTLAIRTDKPEWSGVVEFDTGLFERSTIERWLEHFRRLLEEIVRDPYQPITKIRLLSSAERDTVLWKWSGMEVEPAGGECVHRMVSRQAVERPHAVAAKVRGRELTYGELEKRANRLAARLLVAGAGVGERVGVCLPRSLDLPPALLAVWKAGAACVPLDPEYPDERLRYMLDDSGVRIALTDEADRRRLPASVNTLMADADWEAGGDGETVPPDAATGETTAYVIYTSGSTGRPKGIAMPHRALANLIAWQARVLGDRPGMRVLQFAPPSFDVSFQEIGSTLSFGGTLVLPEDAVRRDPTELWRLIAEESVERLFLPFVVLQQLAESRDIPAELRLREVITAGEQLRISPAIVKLFRRLPGCLLQNQYGPAESHVVTAHTLEGNPRHWPRLPPIGRPVAGSSVFVLDRGLEPVPIGVFGEICIGGVSVAEGYVNAEELTAEKFIQNPFPNARMKTLYRSGDIGRWLPDGNLEFQGRVDDQVKVRGFRVEFGEIEAALLEHQAVKAAAVAAHGEAGDRRLAAYVVRSGEPAEAAEIRQHLHRKLPSFLTPEWIVFVDALPLTASGKVNRRALSAPWSAPGDRAAATRQPADSTEAKLLDIWRETLQVPSLELDDNFFEFGGHSMLAVKLMARMKEAVKTNAPLSVLFEAPTVAAFAAFLRREAASPEQTWVVEIQPHGRRQPVFFVGAGLAQRDFSLALGPEHPLIGIAPNWSRLEPPHTVAGAAEVLVRELRRREPEGPYALCGWCRTGLLAFEAARDLEAAGRTVNLVALFDAPGPSIRRGRWRRDLAFHFREWWRRPREEKAGYLRERLAGFGCRISGKMWEARWRAQQGFPGAARVVAPDALMLSQMAMRDYQPEPFGGRVTLFAAENGLLARHRGSKGYGWAEVTPGGLEIVEVVGDHRTMFSRPNVDVIAATIRVRLGDG